MPKPREVKGRIKGAAIRGFVEWYAERHDRQRLYDIARALPEEEREAFDFDHPSLGVLPSVWFPATAIHRVIDELTKGLSPKEWDGLAQGAADATVAAMMKGVQRVLFSRLLTPGAYGTFANLAFKANYDEGHVVNEILGPKRHLGTVHDWSAHHPFLCRMNVAVKVAVYGQMRCKNARLERRYCKSSGDDVCGSIIVWD
jgi:hypothetical protein